MSFPRGKKQNSWKSWKGKQNSFQKESRPGEFEVTLSLCGNDKVQAVNRFSSELNELYKNQGGYFAKEQKAWVFPLKRYYDLQAALNNVKTPSVIVKGIAPQVLKVFDESLSARKENVVVRLPHTLQEKLRPFQLAGVQRAVANHGRLLIADDMGLGKTVQALSISIHYSSEWPLLIICPSSLRINWAEEVQQWLGIGEEQIQVITTGKQRPNRLICIISYDLATKMAADLARFKVVIVDECHYLKNPESQRTKSLVPLVKAAKRAVMLSGTPALSRPMELFMQLHALVPDVFKNLVPFGKRYCNGYQGPYGWDFTGSSNLSELQLVMAKTIMIRRLKKDVLQELPDKLRQQVYVDPSPKYRKGILGLLASEKKLEDKIRQSHGDSRQALENEKRALVIKLYHESGLAKLPGALNYLDNVIDKGIKALLFAHHRDVLDEICNHLLKKKIKFIVITGETPQSYRSECCHEFQTNDDVQFAVLSITAAGVGLTLTEAQTVVFFELFWNPGQLFQAEDRAHRIGQKKAVDIKYLICRGTVDDKMWDMVQRKTGIVGKSMNASTDDSNSLKVKVMEEGEKRIKDDSLDSFFAQVTDQAADVEFKVAKCASSSVHKDASLALSEAIGLFPSSTSMNPASTSLSSQEKKRRRNTPGTEHDHQFPRKRQKDLIPCPTCGGNIAPERYSVHSQQCLQELSAGLLCDLDD
eukprot:m.141447 g.141447  ORF g.141447 m.141447 type:complete len:701 (-) comp14851_c0_seq3:3-2105(-)